MACGSGRRARPVTSSLTMFCAASAMVACVACAGCEARLWLSLVSSYRALRSLKLELAQRLLA
jgi:hypothetical protein